MRGSRVATIFLMVLGACGDGDDTPSIDAGPDRPAWDKGLPAASVMGARRGLTPARGIIHLHSPYSHDACDGDPKNDNGTIREDCLADLRAALCTVRVDFAALTDHDDSMADVDWGPEIFVARGADEPLLGMDGLPYASRVRCDDGHTFLLYVGGENDLMPIMLDRHPAGTVQERHDVYNANDAAAVETYRTLGGVAWIAHGESKDLPLLRSLGLDGMEIYNLHANIDPDIRADFLGLDGPEAIMAAVQFADMNADGPEPDLAILGFLGENAPSLEKWQTLLGEGARLAGSAGTDAHQNALPLVLRDGERGDSYRRMLRWFANVALVADPTDPAQIEAAVAAGRFFVAFEVFGTPVGFDWRADQGAASIEMGGTVTLAAGAVELVAVTPTIHALDPALPSPVLETRIVHIPLGGAPVEVASGTGEVRFTPTAPGAYRAEVRIVPAHLRPHLGTLAPKGYADAEYVWIYANPIYLE
jgi:hypothetical protein